MWSLNDNTNGLIYKRETDLDTENKHTQFNIFDEDASSPLENKFYEERDCSPISSAPAVVSGAFEVLKNIYEWVSGWMNEEYSPLESTFLWANSIWLMWSSSKFSDIYSLCLDSCTELKLRTTSPNALFQSSRFIALCSLKLCVRRDPKRSDRKGVKVSQSCLTLFMDYTVHEVLQARIPSG